MSKRLQSFRTRSEGCGATIRVTRVLTDGRSRDHRRAARSRPRDQPEPSRDARGRRRPESPSPTIRDRLEESQRRMESRDDIAVNVTSWE